MRDVILYHMNSVVNPYLKGDYTNEHYEMVQWLFINHDASFEEYARKAQNIGIVYANLETYNTTV